MPREQLQALAADVRRLLAVGTAAGAERLKQRARALHELGRQAPALAQVARAVERAADAPPESAAAALLDLSALLRQARGALAITDGAGELAEVGEAGPWESPLPAAPVYALADALAAPSAGRTEKVRGAIEGCTRPDLRLLQPLLAAFDERRPLATEVIADRAAALLAPAAVPELRRGLDLKGNAVAGRRLVTVCRLDATAGRDLCRCAFAEGSEPVRLAAVEGALVADPEHAGDVLRERLAAESADTGLLILHRLVWLLGHAVPAAAPAAAPALVEALRSLPGQLVPAAVVILGQIGRPAVGPLTAALRQGDEALRRRAVAAVAAIGVDAAPAAPEVLDYLRGLFEQGQTDRAFCDGLGALAAVGPAFPEAVPFLTAVVASCGPGCARAATALKRIGRPALPAVGALARALQVRDRDVRFAVASALAAIAPESPNAAAALGEMMAQESHPPALTAAVEALRTLGPAAAAAAPALLRMLADRKAEQWAAAMALRVIGPHDPAAVVPGVVEALLKEWNGVLRVKMIEVLEHIGPPAREAELALGLFAESDEIEEVRALAARALRAVRGEPAPA